MHTSYLLASIACLDIQEHFAACALLVLRGYSVMLCNYRGSTGYGQALVDSLCGKVGRQDVDDMVLAVEQVLSKRSFPSCQSPLLTGFCPPRRRQPCVKRV